MRKINCILIIALALFACNSKEKADLVVYNATIYTVDSGFTIAQSMAIANGRILATGTNEAIKEKYEATESIDASGKFIYPGLIDAHSHFYRYGLGLQTADLVGTKSWDEILAKLQSFAAQNTEGWIIGRGWDQNDWDIKEFPTNAKLNELFPGRPVLLSRIDGHAAIANQQALDLAGLKAGRKLTGGDIEMKNGKLTGILIDNAIGLVRSKVPGPTPAQMKAALMQAQQNCFAVGLTTVDDCGVDYDEVQFFDSLHKSGELKMRIYGMLSDSRENYNAIFSNGIIDKERLQVRAFKVYADGALGSRGACLLEPYADKPGWQGFLLSEPAHFDSVAKVIYAHPGFQMCTHAIGDSGNRAILNIYAKYLGGKNDRRWRIEHAQVVNKNDFDLFGNYNVIPSVQPTHATSDMYWAGDRLGPERVKGAYAFNDLMKQNGWIPLGTDFPVEDISPFKTFFAAVARKDDKGWPEGGYQMENALSREDALRGMTSWAARSNFEEKVKGSLEKDKYADFVILDKDLLKVPENEILGIQVLYTFVGGEKVYERK